MWTKLVSQFLSDNVLFDDFIRKVLKEISVGDLQPDETVDAMHEANLLRNLDHPGIVKFSDSFCDGEFFCIVTEYCEVSELQLQYLCVFKKLHRPRKLHISVNVFVIIGPKNGLAPIHFLDQCWLLIHSENAKAQGQSYVK